MVKKIIISLLLCLMVSVGYGAMSFDGTNDYAWCPRAWSVAASTGFMIDFWWRSTSTNYDKYMFVIPKYDAQPRIVAYWTSNNGAGTIEFHYIDTYGNDNVVMHGFGVAGTWTHTVLSTHMNGALRELRLWLGTTAYEASVGASAEALSFSGVVFGARENGGSGDYWSGQISRFRISKGQSLDAIKQVCYPVGTAIQANIPLGDNRTQVWIPAENTSNNCASFNGVQSYMTCASDPKLNVVTNFTAEFFLKCPTTTSTYDDFDRISLVHKSTGTGAGAGEWETYIATSTNKLSFHVMTVTDIDTTLTTNWIGDNNWHHCAFVRDNTNTSVSIYMDGTLRSSSTFIAGNCSNTSPLYISRKTSSATDRVLNGQMDELAIDNVVKYTGLTYVIPTKQITTGDAIWHFNEQWALSASVIDSSGNGFTLTRTGVSGEWGYPFETNDTSVNIMRDLMTGTTIFLTNGAAWQADPPNFIHSQPFRFRRR